MNGILYLMVTFFPLVMGMAFFIVVLDTFFSWLGLE